MLRSRRCMGIVGVFAGIEAVVSNDAGGSWWSGLSLTSTRPEVSVGCGCAATRNVRKRVLIQAASCNLGLLLRRLTGVGTPRSLQGRALSAILGLIDRLMDLWGRLNGLSGAKWAPDASWGSAARPQAA
ncbi:MAG: hypothetical protein OXM01_12155 [Gemmatimonadota bacterium]|nr:hypothetical protein [Gemmatimonadota bacterium]